MNSAAALNLYMSSMTGNLINGGVLTIGPPGSNLPTSDTFTITGNFTQTGSGHLIIDAASSGYEKVSISGTATLAGTLTVQTPAGWTGGFAYDVLSFASHSGNFSTYNLPSGYIWEFIAPADGQRGKLRIRKTSWF